jgi:hypothetical protein
MSTKTIYKRIALVAVAALGAGVLSVAPANAATGDILFDTSESSGICSVSKSGAFVNSAADQTGVLLTAPLSITMALGGVLALDVDTADENTILNNGTLTVSEATDNNFNYGVLDEISDTAFTLTATAVGTNTLTAYSVDPFTAGVATGATALGKVTITIVATCAGTGYSATFSNVQVEGAWNATPSSTAGDVLTYGAGSDAFINIQANNAYNVALNAATVWVASATGAKVKIGTDATIDDASTSAGTLSAVSTATDGDDLSVRVTPLSAAAGGTAVVTVSANGATVAVRTITFLPEAATIVPIAVGTGVVSGEGYVLYALRSASGAFVPGNVTNAAGTLTSRISSFTDIKDATILKAAPGATTINGVTANDIFVTTAYGVAKFSCNVSGGSGSTVVKMEHETAVSEAVITADVTLKCADGVDTYAISMDKASYKVGEVATLTIAAKDSTGNAVNDFVTINSLTPTRSAGGGTFVKEIAATDAFAAGVKTYQIQMTTAGAFNAVVNLSGATTKSATVGYTVASSGGTTNEDVLKAIVSLIASINKQIAALQKALLRR